MPDSEPDEPVPDSEEPGAAAPASAAPQAAEPQPPAPAAKKAAAPAAETAKGKDDKEEDKPVDNIIAQVAKEMDNKVMKAVLELLAAIFDLMKKPELQGLKQPQKGQDQTASQQATTQANPRASPTPEPEPAAADDDDDNVATVADEPEQSDTLALTQGDSPDPDPVVSMEPAHDTVTPQTQQLAVMDQADSTDLGNSGPQPGSEAPAVDLDIAPSTPALGAP